MRSIATRLRRIARRSLARLEKWRLGRDDVSLQEPLRYTAPDSGDRFIERVRFELKRIEPDGHTPRLEQLLQLLHLAYMHPESAPDRRVKVLTKAVLALGSNDLDAPTESDRPLAYFVSYPRSGNTLATSLTAAATQAQIFAATRGGFAPFSKKIYPRHYPFARIVKDHMPRSCYRPDPCVLIVRDGRDTMVSLAFMTLQNGKHSFKAKGELANFIQWTAKDYRFGSWADNTRGLLKLAEADRKLLLRYEDLSSDEAAFISIIRFFDPGNCTPKDRLHQIFENRNSSLDALRKNAAINRSWGLGYEFEPDSLFHAWSRSRGRSSWRESWDDEAKRAFHETGATELLIELGYETDEDWWKL